MALEDGKNWTDREPGVPYEVNGVVYVVQDYIEPYDGANDPLLNNPNWKEEYEPIAAGLAARIMAAYLGKEFVPSVDDLLAGSYSDLVEGPYVSPRPGAPVKYLFKLSILAEADELVDIQQATVSEIEGDKVEFGSFIEFSKRMEILALKFDEYQKEIDKTTWSYTGPDTLYDRFEFGEEAKKIRLAYEKIWEHFKTNNVGANVAFFLSFPASEINIASASDSQITDWLASARGQGLSGVYTINGPSNYGLLKIARSSNLQKIPFLEPRTLWLIRTIKESTGNVSPFTEFSATADFQGFDAKDIKFTCKSPAVSKTVPQIEYDDFVNKYVKPRPALNEFAPPKKGKGRAVDNKALALLGWDDIKSDYKTIETKAAASWKNDFTFDSIVNEAVTNRRKNVSQYAGDFFMENLPGTPAKIRTIYDLAKYFLSRMDIPTLVSEALACMGLDISLEDLIDLYCDWLLDEFLQIEPEKMNEFALWLDSGSYLPGGEFVNISVTDIAYTIRNYLGELAAGNITQPAFQNALRSDIQNAGWKRFFCEAITAAPFLLGAGISALIQMIDEAKGKKAVDEEKSPIPPFKKCDTRFNSLDDIPIVGTLYDAALKEIERKIEEAIMAWIEEKVILPAREAMWSWQKYCIENEPEHNYGEASMASFPKTENDKAALASLVGNENWLKALFNALTPLEICSLLNAQTVPDELLRYVYKFIQSNAPSSVKLKVNESSKVPLFFKTLGEIIDTEFCEDVAAAFDQQLVVDPCDEQNINLAEQAKRRALKARGLTDEEVIQQIQDEKQRVKDDIKESLRKLVENTETLSLDLEQRMKNSINSALKDSFKQGSNNILESILSSLVPSFQADTIRFISLFKRDPNFLEKITTRIEAMVESNLIKFGTSVSSNQKTPAGESGTISKYQNYTLGIVGEVPSSVGQGVNIQPPPECVEISRHTALMRLFMDEAGWKPVPVETSGQGSGNSNSSPEDIRMNNLTSDNAESQAWQGWPNPYYALQPQELGMKDNDVKGILNGVTWTDNVYGTQGDATLYDPAGLRFNLTLLTEQQIEDLANAAFRYYTRYSWNYTEESIARSYADPDRGLRQHALEYDMVPKRDYANIIDANFNSFTFNPVKDLTDADWADALANVNLLFGHRGPGPWNLKSDGYYQPGTNSADSVISNGYKFAGNSWTDVLDRLNDLYGQGTSGYDERSHNWGLLGGSGWNIQSSKECLLRIFLFRFYLEEMRLATGTLDDINAYTIRGPTNSIVGGHMERALDYYRNGIEYPPGFDPDQLIKVDGQSIRVQRRQDVDNYHESKSEYNVANFQTDNTPPEEQKFIIEVSGPEEGEKIQLEDIDRARVCPSVLFCIEYSGIGTFQGYIDVHNSFLDEFKGIYAEDSPGLLLGAISKGTVRFHLLPQLPDERKTKEEGGSGCIIDRFEIQAGDSPAYSEKVRNVEITDKNNVPTYAKAVEIFRNKSILGEDIIEPGKLQYPKVVNEPLPPQIFQRYLIKKTGDMLVPFSKTPAEQNIDWGDKTLFNQVFKTNLLSSNPPSGLDYTARRSLYGSMFLSLLKRTADKVYEASKNIDPETPDRFYLLKLDLENIKQEAISDYDKLMAGVQDVTDPNQLITMKNVMIDLPNPSLVKAAVKVYLLDFVLRSIGTAGAFKIEDLFSDNIVSNFVTTTILSLSKDVLGKYYQLDEESSNSMAFTKLVKSTIEKELIEITQQLKDKVYTKSNMPSVIDALFENHVIDLAGLENNPDTLKVEQDDDHSNVRVANRFRGLVESASNVPFFKKNATYSGYRHWTESDLIKKLGFVLEKYIKITFKSREDIRLKIEENPELVATLATDNFTPDDVAKRFHEIPVEYRGEMFANKNSVGLPVYLNVEDFKQYYTEFVKDFSQYGDLTPENFGAPAGSIFGWKQNETKYKDLSEDFYSSIEELKNQISTEVDVTPEISAILQEEVALMERICPLVPAGNKSGKNPLLKISPFTAETNYYGNFENYKAEFCPIIWDVADISCPKSFSAPFANPINYGENPYYDEHYDITNTRDLVHYLDTCWLQFPVKKKVQAVNEHSLGGLHGTTLQFRRRHIKQMAPLSDDLTLNQVFGVIPDKHKKILANAAFRYYTLAYYGDYTAFKYKSPVDELSLQAINVIFGGWITANDEERGSWYFNNLAGGDFYDPIGNPLLKGLIHERELRHPTLPGYRNADELKSRLFPADPFRTRINNVKYDPYPTTSAELPCSKGNYRKMGDFLWKDTTYVDYNPVHLNSNPNATFAWGRFTTKDQFIKYMLYGLLVGFDAPYYASWFGDDLDPDNVSTSGAPNSYDSHRVIDRIHQPKSDGGAWSPTSQEVAYIGTTEDATGHPDDGKGTEFLHVAVADWIKKRRWTPASGVDMYRALDLYKNGDPTVISAETGQQVSPLEVFTEGVLVTDDMQSESYDNILAAPLSLFTHDVSYGLRLSYAGGSPRGPKYKSGFGFVEKDLFPDFYGSNTTGDWINNTEDREHLTMKRIKSFLISEPKIRQEGVPAYLETNRHVFTIPLLEQDFSIAINSKRFGELLNDDWFGIEGNLPNLWTKMKGTDSFKLLFEYLFPVKRMLGIIAINNIMTFENAAQESGQGQEARFIFQNTSDILEQTIGSLKGFVNIQDYQLAELATTDIYADFVDVEKLKQALQIDLNPAVESLKDAIDTNAKFLNIETEEDDL